MLRGLIIGTLTVIAAASITIPAKSEGMRDDVYTATLLDLNRIKPSQNPAFTSGRQILNARIVDANQRTLGKVQDIVLAPDGKFQTIVSKVDVTGFRETVAFDVTSYVVDPSPDSFTVSMDKEQLKQSLPQLLSGIETASGEDAPFTLSSIRNGLIYKPDGSQLAQVDDVLADSRAGQVVALLVRLTSGANRGSTVAIPYEAASAQHQGNRAILTVTDQQAQVMTSMAKRR